MDVVMSFMNSIIEVLKQVGPLGGFFLVLLESIIPALPLGLFIGFNIVSDVGILKLPEEEKITSYTNIPYKTLNEWATKNNIEIEAEYEYSDEIVKGNIIRIDVNEGTYVKDIKKIKVTIS